MFFIWLTFLLLSVLIKVPVVVTMFVSFLWWGPVSFFVLLEWWRVHGWVKELKEVQEGLEQKYLLFNIVEEPRAPEQSEVYHLLRAAYRDMHEHIGHYRYAETAYKEYVEIWVHEAKTPIAAIQLLLENAPYERQRDVRAELAKIDGFVEQALYYSKASHANEDFRIAEHSLETVVNDVVKRNARMFIERRIQLTIDGVARTVFTDAKWTSFILQQILVNSLNYTLNPSPSIHIEAVSQAENVVLTIRDNGIGIPPAELHRVFEKGYTGTNGRTVRKATGMGLYIAKQLAERLYMGLTIDSTLGESTTVTVTFPETGVYFKKDVK
ncbi:MAG: sensor histidine kinase [Bacilli bacterium]